jgi:hypothetical protein
MESENLLINDIPYGPYCYTLKDIIPDQRLGLRVRTFICPHFQYSDDVGFATCSFIKTNEFDILLDDQVKICGVNELDEEFDIDIKDMK